MTTTTQAHGGGAQPASIDTSGKVAGGSAQRVYGFDSVEAAQAAGYVCEGGPAMSVALITDAQIASGEWKAEGDPAALAVYTAPSNMPVEGGYAVPVYPVNGWGSTPAPSGPAPLLDLESDTLALSNGDPVSTWADQSGNGYDFTQTGAARPLFVANDGRGYKAVSLNAVDQWMLGHAGLTTALDNLASFEIIIVTNNDTAGGAIWGLAIVLSKLASYTNGQGWVIETDSFYIQEAGGAVYYGVGGSSPNGLHVFSLVKKSNSSFEIWRDGIDFLNPANTFDAGPVTTFANNESVKLGTDGTDGDGWYGGSIYAVRVYAPALSSTDRAAIEAELAARYGITL